MSLGVDDPFDPRPNQVFPIDQGLQGGHHVDISLHVVGSMDPEHTDVRLTLLDDARVLAEHRVDDWVLEYDEGLPACEYLRARLVLTAEDGSLMPPDEVPPFLNRNLNLLVQLESPKGRFENTFQVLLDRINYLQ